jgi:hypothetical protein
VATSPSTTRAHTTEATPESSSLRVVSVGAENDKS